MLCPYVCKCLCCFRYISFLLFDFSRSFPLKSTKQCSTTNRFTWNFFVLNINCNKGIHTNNRRTQEPMINKKWTHPARDIGRDKENCFMFRFILQLGCPWNFVVYTRFGSWKKLSFHFKHFRPVERPSWVSKRRRTASFWATNQYKITNIDGIFFILPRNHASKLSHI